MEQSVLGGTPAPKAAPAAQGTPKAKKSNVGVIIAIIAAALIIAGGVVAAILIVNSNSGDKKDDKDSSQQVSKKDDEDKKDDSKDDEKDDEEESDSSDSNDSAETAYPYTSNDAYFVKINGKKYNFNNTLSEVEKSGFKLSSAAKDKEVKPNQYLILIGGGTQLLNSDSVGFGYTPYNDGSETVTVENAKLGNVSVVARSGSGKETIEKFIFNGGIHVGSSLEDLKKAFGTPTELKTASYGDTYEYKASTYKKFTIKVKDDVVTEIAWTNYGKFAE